MIGSLQLDGLTNTEALDLIVKNEIVVRDKIMGEHKVPNYYYAIKDEYYYVFNN